ncbi:MAG: efflux RND transporter periplasmic adaptor subunit [Planctomycetota bacterium]
MIRFSLISTLSFLAITLATQTGSVAQETDSIDGEVTVCFTEPIETSVVAASVSGVIERIDTAEGAQVRKGTRLAVISHPVLRAEKEIAEAAQATDAKMRAAKADLEIKKRRKLTVESLMSSGHIHQSEIEEKTREYEAALAKYHAVENEKYLDKLKVKKIEAQIEAHYIRSPIAGFVTELHKNLGEHVSASQPQLVTVVRVDQLKARFYLNEASLDQLEVNDLANLLVGPDQKKTTAKVKFISPNINPDSGTGRVEVVIENADLKIRSGTPCIWLGTQS